MRVTKIIKEYVEKTVANALPFGAPREEYIAADQKLNDLCKLLEEQANAYADELLKSFGGTAGRFHNQENQPLHLLCFLLEQPYASRLQCSSGKSS